MWPGLLIGRTRGALCLPGHGAGKAGRDRFFAALLDEAAPTDKRVEREHGEEDRHGPRYGPAQAAE